VVQESDVLEFLDEVVPQRVVAEDASAINAHLKLMPGVAVNPHKKVRSARAECAFICYMFIFGSHE
jgi:hypothetical protein